MESHTNKISYHGDQLLFLNKHMKHCWQITEYTQGGKLLATLTALHVTN